MAPKPLRLMRRFGITNQLVARATGHSFMTVARVLNPETAGSVSLRRTTEIRAKIEELLSACGHQFPPGELWKEYNQKKEAA